VGIVAFVSAVALQCAQGFAQTAAKEPFAGGIDQVMQKITEAAGGTR